MNQDDIRYMFDVLESEKQRSMFRRWLFISASSSPPPPTVASAMVWPPCFKFTPWNAANSYTM